MRRTLLTASQSTQNAMNECSRVMIHRYWGKMFKAQIGSMFADQTTKKRYIPVGDNISRIAIISLPNFFLQLRQKMIRTVCPLIRRRPDPLVLMYFISRDPEELLSIRKPVRLIRCFLYQHLLVGKESSEYMEKNAGHQWSRQHL